MLCNRSIIYAHIAIFSSLFVVSTSIYGSNITNNTSWSSRINLCFVRIYLLSSTQETLTLKQLFVLRDMYLNEWCNFCLVYRLSLLILGLLSNTLPQTMYFSIFSYISLECLVVILSKVIFKAYVRMCICLHFLYKF